MKKPEYQAKLAAPFGVLGIRCEDNVLTGIEFLPARNAVQAASSEFAQQVCDQLQAYFENPDFRFSVNYELHGTAFQQKVWSAMCEIRRGKVRTYGELAKDLASAPRAVGQACGANPVPVVVPCHRITSKSGLGGFAHHAHGEMIMIKRWLLDHERAEFMA